MAKAGSSASNCDNGSNASLRAFCASVIALAPASIAALPLPESTFFLPSAATSRAEANFSRKYFFALSPSLKGEACNAVRHGGGRLGLRPRASGREHADSRHHP